MVPKKKQNWNNGDLLSGCVCVCVREGRVKQEARRHGSVNNERNWIWLLYEHGSVVDIGKHHFDL